MPASPAWLTASQAARRLHVSPKTVTRWANQGRLEHRRTLGGHRRYRPRADRRPRPGPDLPALAHLSRRLEGASSWPDAPPG